MRDSIDQNYFSRLNFSGSELIFYSYNLVEKTFTLRIENREKWLDDFLAGNNENLKSQTPTYLKFLFENVSSYRRDNVFNPSFQGNYDLFEIKSFPPTSVQIDAIEIKKQKSGHQLHIFFFNGFGEISFYCNRISVEESNVY